MVTHAVAGSNPAQIKGTIGAVGSASVLCTGGPGFESLIVQRTHRSALLVQWLEYMVPNHMARVRFLDSALFLLPSHAQDVRTQTSNSRGAVHFYAQEELLYLRILVATRRPCRPLSVCATLICSLMCDKH